MDTLEILLNGKKLPKPTAEYKIERLSKELGGEVIFQICALSYDDVADIKKRNGEEMNLHIVLEGTISPNIKDKELLKHYGVVTPIEFLKNILLPGEVEDLARAIEMLSGFRKATISEIKKK